MGCRCCCCSKKKDEDPPRNINPYGKGEKNTREESKITLTNMKKDEDLGKKINPQHEENKKNSRKDSTNNRISTDESSEVSIYTIGNEPSGMARMYENVTRSIARTIVKTLLKWLENNDSPLESNELSSTRKELYGLRYIHENLRNSVENENNTVELYKWTKTDNLNLICLNHKTICEKSCELEYLEDENEVDFTRCKPFHESIFCTCCGCLPNKHIHVYKTPFTSSSEFQKKKDIKNVLKIVDEMINKNLERIKKKSESDDAIELQSYLADASMNPVSNIDNGDINFNHKDDLVKAANLLILQAAITYNNIKKIEKCLEKEAVKVTNQIWVHSETERIICINNIAECDNRLNNGTWENSACQKRGCVLEDHIKVSYRLVRIEITFNNFLQLNNRKEEMLKQRQQCINQLSSIQDVISIKHKGDQILENITERIDSSKTTLITKLTSSNKNKLKFTNTLKISISYYEIIIKNIKEIKVCKKKSRSSLTTLKWIKTSYHNTICTNHKVVCHEKCRLNYNDKTGTTLFMNCLSFNKTKYCQKCGCTSENHMHARKTLIKTTKRVEEPSILDEKLKKTTIKRKETQKELKKSQEVILEKYNDDKELLILNEKIVSYLEIDKSSANKMNIGTELFLLINEVKVKISEFETILTIIKEIDICIKSYKLVLNVEKWIDTENHNTVCFVDKNVCHENCSLEFNGKTGTDYFLKCLSFSGLFCKECKCKSENHMHIRKKIAKTTQVFRNITEVQIEYKKYTIQLEVYRGQLIVLHRKMLESHFDDEINYILLEKIEFYIGYKVGLSDDVIANNEDRSETFRFINHLKEKIYEFDVIYTNITEIKKVMSYSSKKVMIKRWVDTQTHNTICVFHKSLCHENCGLSFNGCTGSNYFLNCDCFGRKSNCKCGCDSEKHMHARKKFVQEYAREIEVYYTEFYQTKSELTKYSVIYKECYINCDIPQSLIDKLYKCLNIEIEESSLAINIHEESINIIEIINTIKLYIAEIETISILIEKIIISIEKNNLIVETSKWVDTPYHSTVCFNHKTICHEKCGLTYNDKKGTNYFRNCLCFNNSIVCNKCGCISENHMHIHKKLENTKKTFSSISIMVTHITSLYEERRILLEKFTIVLSQMLKEITIKEISGAFYEKIVLCSKISQNINEIPGNAIRNRPEITFGLINDTKIKIFEIDILIIKIEELELCAKKGNKSINTNIWIDTTIENTVCLVRS